MVDVESPEVMILCPGGCSSLLFVMPTAYGYRCNCYPCATRWTTLRGEDRWVAERLSALGAVDYVGVKTKEKNEI